MKSRFRFSIDSPRTTASLDDSLSETTIGGDTSTDKDIEMRIRIVFVDAVVRAWQLRRLARQRSRNRSYRAKKKLAEIGAGLI